MANPIIDMAGQRFGRLTVVSRAENSKSNKVRWLCVCDCGGNTITSRKHLISGASKSCGCYRRELGKKKVTHGMKNTRLYRIWSGMKDRTTNPNSKYWNDYGGRGILICDKWLAFENFMDWAINSGYSEELTIDRVDVNGNYEPSNCRWSTYLEQENNRRNTFYCNYQGEVIPIMELSRKLNISRYMCKKLYGGI